MNFRIGRSVGKPIPFTKEAAHPIKIDRQNDVLNNDTSRLTLLLGEA